MRPAFPIVLLLVLGCSKAEPTGDGRAATTAPVVKAVELPKETPPIPKPAVIPATADMNYKDLLDYMRSKGLTVWMAPKGSSQLFCVVSQERANEWATERYPTWSNETVLVDRFRTEKAAKDHADRVEDGTMWAWGVFVFEGRREAVNHFRTFLTK